MAEEPPASAEEPPASADELRQELEDLRELQTQLLADPNVDTDADLKVCYARPSRCCALVST